MIDRERSLEPYAGDQRLRRYTDGVGGERFAAEIFDGLNWHFIGEPLSRKAVEKLAEPIPDAQLRGLYDMHPDGSRVEYVSAQQWNAMARAALND